MRGRQKKERRPLFGHPPIRGGAVDFPFLPPRGELRRVSPETRPENILSTSKQTITEGLELHPVLAGLRDTGCTEEGYRNAAHVVLDRVLDEIQAHQRSEHLKKSAGQFGVSGHVAFIPED